MKKLFFLILTSIYSLVLYSQNICINGSFEDTIACINYPGDPAEPCTPWYEAVGSPDYFSSVYDSACGYTAVPSNAIGFQYPHSGFAYEGFAVYVVSVQDKREYLGGRLTDSLLTNHQYCVNFYVNPGDKCKYVVDAIGVYFTADSIYYPGSHNVLPFIPQISSQPGVLLNDTLNWTLISGTFTAQGGEKYMTIGNFKNDANTMVDSIQNAIQPFSYYFIDDVSIIDCTVGIEEIKYNKIDFTLFPNPANQFITLDIESPIENKINLTITDIQGKKVYSDDFYSTKNSFVKKINIRNLCEGMYFIQINNHKQIAVKKFIKQ